MYKPIPGGFNKVKRTESPHSKAEKKDGEAVREEDMNTRLAAAHDKCQRSGSSMGSFHHASMSDPHQRRLSSQQGLAHITGDSDIPLWGKRLGNKVPPRRGGVLTKKDWTRIYMRGVQFCLPASTEGGDLRILERHLEAHPKRVRKQLIDYDGMSNLAGVNKRG